MSNQDEAVKSGSSADPARRSDLREGVRHFTYAWIGMWGVVRDETSAFYDKCAARGEETLRTARQRQAKRRGARHGPREAKAMQPMDVALAKAGLATKSEIAALIEQVDALSREVDALAQQRQSQ